MQVIFHSFDLLVVSERKQSSTFAFVANSLTICPPVLKTEEQEVAKSIYYDRVSYQRR